MATIYDVAKLAGVAISTASLALNDSPRVSKDKKDRVHKAARKIGYTPNHVARSLQSGRTGLLGMMIGDVTNPFNGRLIHAVEQRAWESDYLVIVTDTGDNAARERAVLDQLARQRVAGAILFSHGSRPEQIEHLRSMPMPLVLVDHRVGDLEYDVVGADNRLAASMLTEHLIRLGHKRIAFISGPVDRPTAQQRLEGFRSTMTAAGIEVDESLILQGGYQHDPAYAETLRLLVGPERPTAFVAANNVMGLGALKAIKDLGFKCPSEISLTCIDDVPWADALEPRITAVVQPIDELARTACDWLVERITNRNQTTVRPRERIFAPSFVPGTSCAPPNTN